jgi:membrane protease YdiL (CAAX protease family)
MLSTAQPARATADTPAQHSLAQSILLHLLPGLLIVIVFVLSAPLAHQWHLPPFLALCFANVVILLPGVLGSLLYQGYRRNRRLSLDGVVFYQEKMPWRQFVGLTPLILIVSASIIVLLSPLGNRIFTGYFAWVPEMFLLTTDPHAYPRSTLIPAYLLFFLIVAIIAPIIEEIYFRGYLLPRLTRFGIWAAVINAVLFALYHMWTPWLAIGRILGVLPLILVVQWRRNIYVGMAAHVMANALDTLATVALLF